MYGSVYQNSCPSAQSSALRNNWSRYASHISNRPCRPALFCFSGAIPTPMNSYITGRQCCRSLRKRPNPNHSSTACMDPGSVRMERPPWLVELAVLAFLAFPCLTFCLMECWEHNLHLPRARPFFLLCRSVSFAIKTTSPF